MAVPEARRELEHRDAIADELGIRDLVNRYTDATCRHDPSGIADTFAADGEWVHPQIGQPRGHDECRALFARLLEGWNQFVQGLLSGRVHLDPADPDRATGRWYIWEFGQRSDGTDFFASGVYHDEYVREAGAWRFSRRRFDPLMVRFGDAVTLSPFPSDAPEIG